jgi:23S rRNA pseudouridine1911/1915/1917 synthase
MASVGSLSIDKSFAGMRLDVFLASRVAEVGFDRTLSRAEIQRFIAAGLITLNGAVAKSSVKIKANDRVDIQALPPRESSVEAQALPLEIVYEDSDCLVINKAPGVVVHPAAGQKSGTLVNALLHHCSDLAGIGGELRPGIVHRLDKDTSGVIIVAKNMRALHQLVAQFKNRQVHKEYLAITWGKFMPAAGRIDRPVGRHRTDRKRMSSLNVGKRARSALTEWRVLEYFLPERESPRGAVSYVRLLPHTGRTHQLRVHCADLGFPLVGDKVYGRKGRSSERRPADASILEGFPRQALHAEKLVITHTRTGKLMEFYAPLAKDMEALLSALRRSDTTRGAPGAP